MVGDCFPGWYCLEFRVYAVPGRLKAELRADSGHYLSRLEIAFPIRSDQTLQNRLSLYQGLVSNMPEKDEVMFRRIFYA